MSQQFDKIFNKYKEIFLGRQEEIKEFLIKYYEKDFNDNIIENVERFDTSERIKKSGFQKNLSGWRNLYKNIVVTSCVVIKGKQKRYDYKFYFVEEKLDKETIEIIDKAMNRSLMLKKNLKFEEAVTQIEEIIELIRIKEDQVFNKRLIDLKKEILDTKESYEKGLEDITKLEDEIEIYQENYDFKAIVSKCEKIIQISQAIRRRDLEKKYIENLEQTKQKTEIYKEIESLEKKVGLNRTNGKLEAAINNCEKILEISESIKRTDFIEKYSQLIESLKNEIIYSKENAEKEKDEQLRNELKELDEKINTNVDKNELEMALTHCEKSIRISELIGESSLIEKYTLILAEIEKKIVITEEMHEKSIQHEDLKVKIKNLNNEGLEALNKRDLGESLEKYKEIRNLLRNFI